MDTCAAHMIALDDLKNDEALPRLQSALCSYRDLINAENGKSCPEHVIERFIAPFLGPLWKGSWVDG